MEVSGWLNSLATLPLVNELSLSTEQETWSALGLVRMLNGKENFLALPGTKSPIRQSSSLKPSHYTD
jgi:hypothetical protein